MNNIAQTTHGDLKSPEIDLFKNAVCLSIRLRRLGNRRKIDSNEIRVDADKKMIRATKVLIDSNELEAIGRCDGEFKRYLRRKCLPFPLKESMFLLPISELEEVDAGTNKFLDERRVLVAKLKAVFTKRIEESAQRLRELWNSADYPSEEEMTSYFGVQVHYVTFGVPGQLKTVSRAIFKRETEKARKFVTEAAEAMRQLLLIECVKFVNHLTERLTPSPDGKRKQFRASSVTNLVDFLDTFDPRNEVIDFKEMKIQMDKAKDLLKDVDPEILRDDEAARRQVRNGMAEIKETLDKLVVERPSRMISFED